MMLYIQDFSPWGSEAIASGYRVEFDLCILVLRRIWRIIILAYPWQAEWVCVTMARWWADCERHAQPMHKDKQQVNMYSYRTQSYHSFSYKHISGTVKSRWINEDEHLMNKWRKCKWKNKRNSFVKKRMKMLKTDWTQRGPHHELTEQKRRKDTYMTVEGKKEKHNSLCKTNPVSPVIKRLHCLSG